VKIPSGWKMACTGVAVKNRAPEEEEEEEEGVKSVTALYSSSELVCPFDT
jgi:hypothetical protein